MVEHIRGEQGLGLGDTALSKAWLQRNIHKSIVFCFRVLTEVEAVREESSGWRTTSRACNGTRRSTVGRRWQRRRNWLREEQPLLRSRTGCEGRKAYR